MNFGEVYKLPKIPLIIFRLQIASQPFSRKIPILFHRTVHVSARIGNLRKIRLSKYRLMKITRWKMWRAMKKYCWRKIAGSLGYCYQRCEPHPCVRKRKPESKTFLRFRQ